MSLKDQAIIITGGASGIGQHAAVTLAKQGANIIVADFNIDGATKVAADLTRLGVKAFPFKVDVSKAAEMEAMVDFAVEKLGTLNGIFNDACRGARARRVQPRRRRSRKRRRRARDARIATGHRPVDVQRLSAVRAPSSGDGNPIDRLPRASSGTATSRNGNLYGSRLGGEQRGPAPRGFRW